jgi:DNA replication and repair protein RecF
VIRTGENQLRLKGTFLRGGMPSIQEAALSARGRSFRIDGNARPERVAYARAKPVVAFHPGDLSLSSGSSALRRRLLDRSLVYLDPAGTAARLRFQEALRARQELLAQGGRASELSVYEQIVAREGAELTRARRLAANELKAHFLAAFGAVGAPELEVSVEFRPGGTEDALEFTRELERRRGADTRRKAATFGPQRDDLELLLDQRSARSFASQGQQRLLALCLKLAELGLIRQASQAEPLLLLDDVSSELDRERIGAVFRFLASTKSQVFVTTTRPELVDSFEKRAAFGSKERAQFTLSNGKIRRDS